MATPCENPAKTTGSRRVVRHGLQGRGRRRRGCRQSRLPDPPGSSRRRSPARSGDRRSGAAPEPRRASMPPRPESPAAAPSGWRRSRHNRESRPAARAPPPHGPARRARVRASRSEPSGSRARRRSRCLRLEEGRQRRNDLAQRVDDHPPHDVSSLGVEVRAIDNALVVARTEVGPDVVAGLLGVGRC